MGINSRSDRKWGGIDPLTMFVRERLVRERKSALTIYEIHQAARDYFARLGLTPLLAFCLGANSRTPDPFPP
jgi:hypothetical protein